MPVRRGRPDAITPPRRGLPATRSPLSSAPRGGYVLSADTGTDANTSAAVGFRTVQQNVPNPTAQQFAGRILGSLPRGLAQRVGDVGGVSAFAFPLPAYFGWVDVAVFAELTPGVGQNVNVPPPPTAPGLWWYLCNGRTTQIAAQASAALRTMFNGLTMLAGAGTAAPIDTTESSQSPGGADDWPSCWNEGSRSRVWLPPGQNDLFVLADGGDTLATSAAIVWWTITASPNTESAIAPNL